jgi:uncharacterized protein (DUF1015 family)
MSIIKPFRALRPVKDLAAQVASVPYDVINTAEARVLAEESPYSFLRVTRSEIDLPGGTDVYSPEVYQKAQENLAQIQAEGVLIQEDKPSFYVYRLQMGDQTQTGVVACCAVDEYDRNLIKKHEKTRPDKENDRTRHIVTTRAQTGLIFLCYRGTEAINQIVSHTTTIAPLYELVASDGVEHTVWRVETNLTDNLAAAFAEVPCLYVADGHHRAASASRACAELQAANPNHDGTEEYNFVVATLFPAEQLKILAYNRVVKDLNGLTEDAFLQKLGETFVVSETPKAIPENKGETCLYLGGKWYHLRFAVQFFRAPDVIESLDVSILEDYVLRPLLGINDVRTDKRIDFVGGIRGTRELEKLVNSGQWKAAFSMFPTTVEDLLAVADANAIMPPKSTWFEPKLRDGLLIHLI